MSRPRSARRKLIAQPEFEAAPKTKKNPWWYKRGLSGGKWQEQAAVWDPWDQRPEVQLMRAERYAQDVEFGMFRAQAMNAREKAMTAWRRLDGQFETEAGFRASPSLATSSGYRPMSAPYAYTASSDSRHQHQHHQYQYHYQQQHRPLSSAHRLGNTAVSPSSSSRNSVPHSTSPSFPRAQSDDGLESAASFIIQDDDSGPPTPPPDIPSDVMSSLPCIQSVLVRLQRENEYAHSTITDLRASLSAAETQIKKLDANLGEHTVGPSAPASPGELRPAEGDGQKPGDAAEVQGAGADVLDQVAKLKEELRVAKEASEAHKKRADAAEWSVTHLEIRLVQAQEAR